jgi:glycosyltransferase involved in cell wall biosynthesis
MNTAILSVAASLGGMAYKASADSSLRTVLQGLDPPPYYLEPRYRVSLVVPALNEFKYIGNLLRSAHNQVEPFSEIIVADCSDPGEGTAELARSWGAQVVQVPRGNISRSRNLGAEAATGEVLVFADADMVLGQHFTEQALNALEGGAALVHPRGAIYDSMGWHMASHMFYLLRGNHEPSGCVVLGTQTFAALGGYDESFQAGSEGGRTNEDTDLGARAVETFGPPAVRVLPMLVGFSARRLKRFGLFGGGANFATPVRARLVRDGVQAVTAGG